MNSIYRLMGVAAVCVAASFSASAETPAGGTAGAPAASQAPIPTQHCEFKAMSACAPDGDCKEGAEVSGIKVPVKVTVDFWTRVSGAERRAVEGAAADWMSRRPAVSDEHSLGPELKRRFRTRFAKL